MGGTNVSSNLVNLTPREPFIENKPRNHRSFSFVDELV